MTQLTCPHCKSVPDFVKNSKRSGPQTPRAGAWFTCLECGGVSRFHTFLFRGATQTCLVVPSLHEFLDSSVDHALIIETRGKVLLDLQALDLQTGQTEPPAPPTSVPSVSPAVALVTAWLRNHLGNLIDRITSPLAAKAVTDQATLLKQIHPAARRHRKPHVIRENLLRRTDPTLRKYL